MINLRIHPKNPEELYDFFIYGLSLPLVKSHVAYVDMINYIREDWVVNIHLNKTTGNYNFWFYYKESEPAKWYKCICQADMKT